MPVKRPSKTPATPLRRLARAIPLLRSPGRAGVLARAILAALALAALPAAAKTYDVDVATGRASAADGAFYHGETVVFRPVRGREPVTNVEYACVYYQTNGMTAWWKTDTLAFHPTNDVGASAYRFFIEGRDGDGRDWHANGTLRMLPSPGFSPNELPLPVATLDFAAVEVLNAPWAEPSDVAAATNAVAEEVSRRAAEAQRETAAATNALAAVAHTGSYADLSGKPAIPVVPTDISAFVNNAGYVDETVTNALSRRVDGIASTVDNVAAGLAATNNYLLLKGGTVTGIVNVAETTAIYTNQISLVPGHGAGKWGPMIILRRIMGDRIMRGVTIESIDAWDGIATNAATKSALASATNALATVARTGSYADLTGKPTIPTTASDVGAYPSASGEQLSAQVSSIGAYLNAEDARFVVTNYDSVVHIPEAGVEVRLTDNGTNVWTTIWKEMRRWDVFTGEDFNWSTWGGFYNAWTNIEAEVAHKADRAWGAYDSETGGWSPEGYTQISSSNILIAAGMAYQRTITTDGAVWVLQCNTGTATLGGDTNGFFRVIDGDGVTQFEIIKGDRREMGADASGITVAQPGNVMTIPYSVEAAEHPTISCCNNLITANWKDETDQDCLCTVSWSGASGAWVATVTPKTSQSSMFVKATYLAGAETMIRNVAPVSMDSIMLNGVKYYLGTATIDGHTVLTLSTTRP